MTSLLEKPEKIRVNSNVKGTPLSLARNGRPEKVTRIYQHWRVTEEWWGKEIHRDYFRIKTSRGLAYDIYHDIAAGLWYLSKIHD